MYYRWNWPAPEALNSLVISLHLTVSSECFLSFLESRASTLFKTVWREARRCQSRLTDLWFIIHLLGNATIGNDHFGTLGRQKIKINNNNKKKTQGSGPNQPPGHRETSRCSQWPVRAWLKLSTRGVPTCSSLLQHTYLEVIMKSFAASAYNPKQVHFSPV